MDIGEQNNHICSAMFSKYNNLVESDSSNAVVSCAIICNALCKYCSMLHAIIAHETTSSSDFSVFRQVKRNSTRDLQSSYSS